jgi:hypothetical protein
VTVKTSLGLHTQFVGQVLDVKADDSGLRADGVVDVQKLKPLIFAPDSQAYYGIGEFLGHAFTATTPL